MMRRLYSSPAMLTGRANGNEDPMSIRDYHQQADNQGRRRRSGGGIIRTHNNNNDHNHLPYKLSSMESSNDDQCCIDREVQQINVAEMKEKFGENWRDKVSLVKEIRQPDGSIVKDYIIDNCQMISRFDSNKIVDDHAAADLHAFNRTNSQAFEKKEAGDYCRCRSVHRHEHRRQSFQNLNCDRFSPDSSSVSSSKLTFNHLEAASRMASVQQPIQSNNDEDVQYEVVDANGNKVELIGNIGELKRMAGSVKEVKQPDGTIVKEYILDDPNIINQIQSSTYSARPPHIINEHPATNNTPFLPHSKPTNNTDVPSHPPPGIPLNYYHQGENVGILQEIVRGIQYGLRIPSGKYIKITSERGAILDSDDLRELTNSLHKFLNSKVEVKKAQIARRTESTGMLGIRANDHYNRFNDNINNVADPMFANHPKKTKDTRHSINRPTLVDLSEINPMLGTYRLDENGRIIGDISYKLTRKEMNFIQEHLRKGGLLIDFSNVIPRNHDTKQTNLETNYHHHQSRQYNMYNGGNNVPTKSYRWIDDDSTKPRMR